MPTFTLKVPGGRLGHILAGAAAASVIGGTAIAVTSPDFTYSTVKRGHQSIAPAAMIPRHNGIDYAINSNVLISNNAGISECFATGVNLPQGAVVETVNTWYKSDASGDLGIFVYRHNLGNGNVHDMISPIGIVADNSNTRRVVTRSSPAAVRTIDNATWDYQYWVCIQPGTIFYGARINYRYRSAGD
jgi:hypothetical protein